MKKTLHILLLITLVAMFLPNVNSVKAIIYQATVTVSSVKIPERAAVALATNDPTTEFCFDVGSTLQVRNGSTIVRSVGLSTPASQGGYNCSYNKSGNYLGIGSSATITWPYNSGDHLWFGLFNTAYPNSSGGTKYLCNADCSPVAVLNGSTAYYGNIYILNSGTGWLGSVNCGTPPCWGSQTDATQPVSTGLYLGTNANPGFDLGGV